MLQQHLSSRSSWRAGPVLVVVAGMLMAAQPASAGGPPVTNVMTKSNTQLHGAAGKTRADVRFDTGARWAQQVRATASARADVSCDDCQGASITFQVVAGNSIAIDQSAVATSICSSGCSSIALNYTFAVQTAEAVSFSAGQRAVLADVEKQLKALDRSRLRTDDVASRVAAQADRVLQVLAEGLESSGDGGKGSVGVRRSMSRHG